MIETLKEACLEVHARTKGMAGTARGNRQMGRGAGGDISRRMDLVAEKSVLEVLKRRKVDATIIGEECGRIKGKHGYIIMDAIDGTTNAAHKLPFYCCSLAFAPASKLSAVSHAAVIDLVNGDLYYALKGKGAFCNGKRIRVKKAGEDAIIGLNISGIGLDTIQKLSPIISKANHIRQFGAIALEMCFLAKGHLDACIDLREKVRPTDIAAACLIIREAGGQVYSSSGEELEVELDLNVRISLSAFASEKLQKEFSSHLYGK